MVAPLVKWHRRRKRQRNWRLWKEGARTGLSQELEALCGQVHKLAIGLDSSLPDYDLRISRQEDRLVLHTGLRKLSQHSKGVFRNRALTALWWFVNADQTVQQAGFGLSDGDQPTLGAFSFCSQDPGVSLVPDPYFLRSRGYQNIAAHGRTKARAWADRNDQLVWRGGTNGQGLASFVPDHSTHLGMNPRVRLAVQARNLPNVDVRFAPVSGRNMAAYEDAGLMGDFIPLTAWGTQKFAIDIDGFSNAWSNLLERFHLGCCVLKIDSAHGFRQWYYDRLIPFETHIPVRADLSDLEEKLDWVRANDAECRAIAANGQALARSLDFDTVTRWAGDAITARAAR